MAYNYKDIKKTYKRLGVESGKTVLLKTDLRYLGAYDHPERNEVLYAHLNVLSDLLDLNKGTLVVSTASTSLCNSDRPFDLDKTPSEQGVLTEYIRQRTGSIRSFHPFMSYSAIGKHAKAICEDVSRHSYGPETPKARMLDLDTLYVSIGLHPRLTCTTIHHIELIMGAPYRYTKEFLHPVVRNGKIRCECFYLYVWYKECNLKKNRNIKIFNNFRQSGDEIKEEMLGRGKVYSYSMNDFYKRTTKLLSKDIYAWLDRIPENKPYCQTR